MTMLRSLLAMTWVMMSRPRGGGVSYASAASSTTTSTDELLQQITQSLQESESLQERMQATMQSIDATLTKTATWQQDLSQCRADVQATQQRIQTQFNSWNQQQYQDLQDQLQNVLKAEIKRRQHSQNQVDEYLLRRKDLRKKQKQQSQASSTAAATGPPQLTREEMEQILSPDTLLSIRDAKMEDWINSLLEQTMQDRPLLPPQLAWVKTVQELLGSTTSTSTTATATSSSDADTCWTLVEATEFVQQALTNHSHDGVGLKDHALGGRIAHLATSPTYYAPPSSSSTAMSLSSTTGETWGTSVWRDYLIPQEVEDYILNPYFDGWQDWPVHWPPTALPHSLARLFAAGPASSSSSSSSVTAPPEAILQTATFPGACWPMQGSHGHVTIVLPYDIYPTAVTIDHVSPLLVAAPSEDHDDSISNTAQRSAAPRTLRVVGYGACEDKDCHGLEYDDTEVYDLFGGRTIAYDAEKPSSVQTFWVPTPRSKSPPSTARIKQDADAASCTAPHDSDDDDEAESAVAACDEGFATLSPDTMVRAVKLEVLDNWGNSDYTCLYRVRIHGSPSR